MLASKKYLSIIGLNLGGLLANFLWVPIAAKHLSGYEFSQLMYWVGVASLCIVVTDFGFNLSATKAVASAGSTPAKRKKISSVFWAKALLFFVTGSAFFLLMAREVRVHGGTWGYAPVIQQVIATILLGHWLLQAQERIVALTAAQTWSKVLVLVTVIAWPSEAFTGSAAAALVSTPLLFISIYIFYSSVFVHEGLELSDMKPDLQEILRSIKESVPAFLGTALSCIYTLLPISLAGYLLGATTGGQLASAYKLKAIGIAFITPLAQLTFARACKSPESSLYLLPPLTRKVLIGSCFAALTLTFASISAPATLYSAILGEIGPQVKPLAVTLFSSLAFSVCSQVIAVHCFIARSAPRLFTLATSVGASIFLIGLLIIRDNATATSIAMLMAAAEFSVFASSVYYLMTKRPYTHTDTA